MELKGSGKPPRKRRIKVGSELLRTEEKLDVAVQYSAASAVKNQPIGAQVVWPRRVEQHQSRYQPGQSAKDEAEKQNDAGYI